MYIIMLGAPGSGKGTIGAEICNEFGLKHVATGDIFRNEIKNQTDLGKKASEYISQGKLVPDEITIAMVESNIKDLQGVLLDGFPRTTDQAEALKRFMEENNKDLVAVINLNVPDDDIVKRTSSRVICPNKSCGASFNTVFMPPKVEGICDKCGSKLIKREDDNPDTIRDRLQIYHDQTEPLIEYYKNEKLLETIDIDIYIEDIKERTTAEAIKRINERNK